MERERRRIYDYFAAEDVREEGRIVRSVHQELNEDSSKNKRDLVVEEGTITAKYELKVLIVSLARLSLLPLTMRFLLKTAKKLNAGGTSHGVE